MASELFQRDESESVCERQRRQSLHQSCSKKTLVAAAATAFLVCVSPAVASSRHIPPTRRVSTASGQPSGWRIRSFLSPRKNSDSSHRPIVPPLEAAASSSSSLRLSSSPGEESEIPSPSPLNSTLSSTSTTYGGDEKEDDETRVTTTSFFQLPSETTRIQELQGLAKTRQQSLFRPRPKPTTQAHVQKTFVVSLMGLAGFVEGFCIRKHGCFPNLMTGTILKVAEAVGSWDFPVAGIHASMIACYVGGGYVFSKWKSNNGDSNKEKQKQTRSSLVAVSVLSGLFLLMSDVLGGIPLMQSFRLPLLAAGFGIINAGTVDVGAGVTYALTGHVTKIGQGLATGGLARPKDSSKTSAARTSGQGLLVFSAAALLANLACGVVETQGIPAVFRLVPEKLPIGTTMLVAYSWVFQRYLKASENVSLLEQAKSA